MLALSSSNPSTMHLRISPSFFMRCYLIFHVPHRLNRHNGEEVYSESEYHYTPFSCL